MSDQRRFELETEILKHKNYYYKGKPLISDEEYDGLEEELKSLDPNNYVLSLVGTTIFSSKKIKHSSKMLSLNKTYKVEDLLSWKDERDLLCTEKIDGSSCSLIYKNGKLELAKTRGDGTFGENISNKVLFIKDVPRKSVGSESDFEVRGEVYCTQESLIAIGNEMKKRNLETPSSQRNIVAGILGRKDHIDLAKYLNFKAFELISEKRVVTLESDKFKLLESKGFVTPEYFIIKSGKEIETRLAWAQDFIENGDYLIDGLVFTLNSIKLHDELGATAHHPRYKMAFKFQGQSKVTTIESISWGISRNGIATPVANVEPVELSGAMVSRVTLHNFGMVKNFELKAGDKIEVVRSGEVIPKFLSVVESSNEDFSFPKSCPSCDSKLIERDIRLICENDVCDAKLRDRLNNYIKKIGIEDLSEKRIQELINANLLSTIDTIYDLSVEKLMTIDKVKDKLATKLVTSINKSKNVDLVKFLSSLGLSGAFNKCEKVVMNGFNSLDKVLKMTVEDLISVEGFAEKSSEDFDSSITENNGLIEKLLSKGVIVNDVELVNNDSSPVKGLKFCITGSLTRKRSEVAAEIKKSGGLIVSSVTSKTDYLITNDKESTSSKFKKAKELEIPILSEDSLTQLISGQ